MHIDSNGFVPVVRTRQHNEMLTNPSAALSIRLHEMQIISFNFMTISFKNNSIVLIDCENLLELSRSFPDQFYLHE